MCYPPPLPTPPQVQFEDMKNMLNEVSQMNVDMKEKDHMASVVETAEDWIDRVKQALNDNEESTITMLQQLVNEADSIPVSMGELQMLQCEINARKWSNSVVENLEKSSKANIDTLHKLLKEATKIRESMPNDLRSNKKSYRLEEENRLQVIVNQADNWKTKLKKMLSNKQGATVEKFQQMISEAESIPVNLSSSIKQIESVFAKVEEWKQEFADQIKFCDKFLLKLNATTEDEMRDDEDTSETMEAGGDGESGGGSELQDKIELSALEKCINAAEKTGAQMDELTSIRTLVDSGKSWLEKTEKLFDSTQTRSKRASAAASSSTASASTTSSSPTGAATTTTTATTTASKLSKVEVEAHINAASGLPFDFKNHVIKLENSLKYALEWQRRAVLILEEVYTYQQDEMLQQQQQHQQQVAVEFEFDEELVEKMEMVLLEADSIIVQVEEEAIITAFLSLYEWCEAANTALNDSTSTKATTSSSSKKASKQQQQQATTQSFDSLLTTGKVLLGRSQAISHKIFQPLIRTASGYFGSISSIQHKVASWCSVTKKAVESSSGVTIAQATELLAVVRGE
jgi:hypothetical protein